MIYHQFIVKWQSCYKRLTFSDNKYILVDKTYIFCMFPSSSMIVIEIRITTLINDLSVIMKQVITWTTYHSVQ